MVLKRAAAVMISVMLVISSFILPAGATTFSSDVKTVSKAIY